MIAQKHFFYHFSAPSAIKDVQIVELPIVDSMHPRPPYMPLSIPEDISEKLIKLHGQPAVWWLGQFLKYMLRPQPHLAKDIEATRINLGFQHPIVGYVNVFRNVITFKMPFHFFISMSHVLRI